MNQAFIALGTNIEPRKEHLEKALHLLAQDEGVKVGETSSIYQTAPVGYTEQADFLNMVIQIKTTHSSIHLLDACQKIEQQLARNRGIRVGPRTIDLDILVYNQEHRKPDRLTTPQPRMHDRPFVLIPLPQIAPSLIKPTHVHQVLRLIRDQPSEANRDVVKWK